MQLRAVQFVTSAKVIIIGDTGYRILAYKSLSRISCPLKIESVRGPKSLTRV